MRQLRTKKLGRKMAEKRNIKTCLSKTENRKVLRWNLIRNGITFLGNVHFCTCKLLAEKRCVKTCLSKTENGKVLRRKNLIRNGITFLGNVHFCICKLLAEKRCVKTCLSKMENGKVLRRNGENGKAKSEKRNEKNINLTRTFFFQLQPNA